MPDLISIVEKFIQYKELILSKSIVHAILYHSPSISDTNFCVLIGRDQNELKDST